MVGWGLAQEANWQARGQGIRCGGAIGPQVSIRTREVQDVRRFQEAGYAINHGLFSKRVVHFYR